MIKGDIVVTPLDTPVCALGEGPVWVEKENAVYWTDIHNRRLWRRNGTGEIAGWDMPERLCSFAFRNDGSMIAAFETGIARYCLETADTEWIVRPYQLGGRIRFNDGKLSPTGWFYAGSMDEACAEDLGALWAVSPEGEARTILEGICVSNSLAFAPDGRTAWFADSMKRRVDRYSVDIATGRFRQRALHLDCSGIPGIPDGSCLDSRGRLWTAFYGGGRVVCSTHDGKMAMEIMLPASQPTCCTVGGRQGQSLIVTTAAENMTKKSLEAAPANGRLLEITGCIQMNGPTPMLEIRSGKH